LERHPIFASDRRSSTNRCRRNANAADAENKSRAHVNETLEMLV
jgi:hypothetical protein